MEICTRTAFKNVLNMPKELKKVILSRGVRQPAVAENDFFITFIFILVFNHDKP